MRERHLVFPKTSKKDGRRLPAKSWAMPEHSQLFSVSLHFLAGNAGMLPESTGAGAHSIVSKWQMKSCDRVHATPQKGTQQGFRICCKSLGRPFVNKGTV